MSENFSLIIKNGHCYIDGKLIQTDLGISANKIKKIGQISPKGINKSKIIDASNLKIIPESSTLKFILENQAQQTLKI